MASSSIIAFVSRPSIKKHAIAETGLGKGLKATGWEEPWTSMGLGIFNFLKNKFKKLEIPKPGQLVFVAWGGDLIDADISGRGERCLSQKEKPSYDLTVRSGRVQWLKIVHENCIDLFRRC